MKPYLRNLMRHFKRLVLGEGKGLEQKRQMTRLECQVPVECLVEGRKVSAIATDLGRSGLRLSVGQRLKEGTIVGVAYEPDVEERLPRVVARVRWCRSKGSGYEVGLEYLETEDNLTRSWVSLVLEAMGFKADAVFERRRTYRTDGSLRGRILTSGGGNYFGNVANLGVGGALFEVSKALAPGTPVEVEVGPTRKLALLKMAGRVRHARHSDRPGRWLNGVAFQVLDEANTELLGRYVFHLMEESN